MDSALLTDRQASELLNVSRSRFYELVNTGELGPKIRIGRSARYLRADIEAFIERLAADAREGSSGAGSAA